MAITNRKGLSSALVKSKLLPGELAVTTDTGELYFCYSAGNVKKVATFEDVQAILDASPEAYIALQALLADLALNPSELTNILNNVLALQSGKADKADAPTLAYDGGKYLINNPYRYGGSLSLKGQMHCHTTNSDGLDTPTALVVAYKNAGYNFIAITDHNYVTPDPSVSGITFIQSYEDTYSTHHCTTYDIATIANLPNIQDFMTYETSAKKLVSIAHPRWFGTILDVNDMIGYYNYNFTEIYNAGASSIAENVVDRILSSGKKIFFTSVDDCHSIAEASMFNKGYVIVKADLNDKDSILKSLRSGNFYASNGNTLELSLEGNVVTATSAENSNITFIGANGAVLKTVNNVTTANYTICGSEQYVRVKSTKVSDNTCAWSQPIFIDMIGSDDTNISKAARNGDLYGIQSQAIINGNCDVNQRGIESQIIPTGQSWTGGFMDKFWYSGSAAGATMPNFTRYRRTMNEIKNSSRCIGMSWDGAETGTYTGFSEMVMYTRIENGTRLLCGANKKVTLSFYAKCGSGTRKLGIIIKQRYGTGGSPSASEDQFFTVDLNYYWDQYAITINTNSINDKSFGSNYDDYLQVSFVYMWNDHGFTGNQPFGTANSVEITQMKVNQGETALPFHPKTYDEELRDCQRYLEFGFSGNINKANYSSIYLGGNSFKTTKRISPTVTLYANSDLTNPNLINNESGVLSGNAVVSIPTTKYGITQVQMTNALSATSMFSYYYLASAEI